MVEKVFFPPIKGLDACYATNLPFIYSYQPVWKIEKLTTDQKTLKDTYMKATWLKYTHTPQLCTSSYEVPDYCPTGKMLIEDYLIISERMSAHILEEKRLK